MNLTTQAIDDAQCDPEGGTSPPRTGFTPDALPEVQPSPEAENSYTGVSTHYAHTETDCPSPTADNDHWYVLRATYGRVRQSCDYLAANGITVYHPTIRVCRIVNGKRKLVEESRLPNIFFAHSTVETLKRFVYDNANLPHLRFYCRRVGIGSDVKSEPLIVPDRQMKSLKIICDQQEADNIIVPKDDRHFDKGETVIVTGGDFKGVIGKVARYCKQLRVAVIIEGLLTIATAYVPRGYLKPYNP